MLLFSAPAIGQGVDIDWRIYAQLAADQLNAEDVEVDFDRIRVRGQANGERLSGVVQLELAADDWDRRQPGATADVLFDAYMDYSLNERHQLRAGQFKTPMGLDFGLPPNAMEITKRGMEFGLIMNRATGVMLSGRRLSSGLGYDLGLFNLAGRSGATMHTADQEGEEFAWVVRGHYARGNWRAELSHGESAAAGGPDTADYRATDFGWAWERDGLIFKYEWIRGRGVHGNAQRLERVYYAYAAYRLREDFELVARHFNGNSEISGAATTLTNTYLGFTWDAFSQSDFEGRVQLNYVLAGGDEGAYTGLRGYRDDALLLQYQLLFAR